MPPDLKLHCDGCMQATCGNDNSGDVNAPLKTKVGKPYGLSYINMLCNINRKVVE